MRFDNDHAPLRRDDALSEWRTASALAELLSFEPSSLDAKPKAAGPGRTAEALSRFAAAIRRVWPVLAATTILATRSGW